MFVATEAWNRWINIGVIVLMIAEIYNGAKKGALRQILSWLATVATYWLAWILCVPFGSHFPLLKKTLPGFANSIVWFILFVIIFRLLFAWLLKLVRKLQRLTGIKQLSRFFGAVIGALIGVLWCCFFAFVLRTDLVQNGSSVVDASYLRQVESFGHELVLNVVPEHDTETAKNWFYDLGNLTEEQRQEVEYWLSQNP